MLEDARLKLEAMDWHGVAMMEYRWDPETDRFYLMEMNARFWAALHLALFSGVNFPLLLADAFFKRSVDSTVTDFPEGILAMMDSTTGDRLCPLTDERSGCAGFALAQGYCRVLLLDGSPQSPG